MGGGFADIHRAKQQMLSNKCFPIPLNTPQAKYTERGDGLMNVHMNI
jgi:hypothetical protein